MGIQRSYEVEPKFKKEMDKNPEWFEIAKLIEDYPKASSVHPAGTLISPVNLNEYIPLIKNEPSASTKKEPMLNVATSLDLKDAEFCCAIKYDFLSIVTLDIINNTELEVDFKPDFDDDSWYEDDKVWDLIGSVHTTTLFQIGSRIYKERMYRLKPHSIEELSHCLALVRGPCIQSKLDKQYIGVLEGTRQVQLIHPFYDEVTKETNGVLLYQEQVIKILINWGFDPETAFKIMKYSSKKKEAELEAFKPQFDELSKKNNISKDKSEKVWKIIYDTHKYSFNKSHGVAYALLVFYSAYLRAYYPLEWLKNALTNAYERNEEIEETINECRASGIKFLPVDINKSKYEFTIEDDKIRFGFVAVKGIGRASYKSLEERRPYTSLKDLINKNNNDLNDDENLESSVFNKSHTIASILIGALSEFETDRLKLMKEYIELTRKASLTEDNILIISNKNHLDMNMSYTEIDNKFLSTTALTTPARNFKPFFFGTLRDKARVTIEAIILEANSRKDSKKKMMMDIKLDTYGGVIEAKVLSSDYEKLKQKIKSKLYMPIKIYGQKNEQYNNLKIEKIIED